MGGQAMQAVAFDTSWTSLVGTTLAEDLDQTRFLQRCRQGLMSRPELVRFVRQHHFYSRHFTRYLLALTSNLPDEADRLALMDNLFDEMGLGDHGGVPHSQIYREMMRALRVELGAEPILPSTQHLIDTMFECCRSPRPMVGFGALCLGAEAIVPRMYSSILRGFDGVGEPRANLSFFEIHIEADDEHAHTMRRIIDRELERDPQARTDLEYGASRAIAARIAFFEALDQGSGVRRRYAP
jgi:pyrroloquinoline-quinone synthase